MNVRPADYGDLSDLINLAREFVEESLYGWHFYEEATQYTFAVRIDSDDTDILVAYDDGNLSGGIMVALAQDFCVERIGYIEKFYIPREYRGTRAGRRLVQSACEWFQVRECRAAFATATANIGAAQSKQFINLFRKFGFAECGPTLVREFNG